MIVETLCHPDDKHWCKECCKRRGSGSFCTPLGKLSDGSSGCLVYDGPKEGIGKIPGCDSFNCLTICKINNPETIAMIRKEISCLPPGEFRTTEVLKKMNLIEVKI